MFKPVRTQTYENGRGYRIVFKARRNVFLHGDEGRVVFVPRGEEVEVSIIHLPSSLLEAAVIYQNAYIAFRRGPDLTAETVLNKLVV